MRARHLIPVAILWAIIGLAATDPMKYRRVIDVAVVMYGLRLINRLVFASEIREAFDVSQSAMIRAIVLIVFFGTILLILRPKGTEA